MDKKLHDQKGIGGIIIILAVLFVIIAIAVMAYFLLNGSKDTVESKPTGNGGSNTETVITDDQIPLRICETGDSEECNDPVSNATVDKVVVDDLP